METFIRIVANKQSYDDQNNILETVYDIIEFAGIALASIVVLSTLAFI